MADGANGNQLPGTIPSVIMGLRPELEIVTVRRQIMVGDTAARTFWVIR